jgi:uncharacterized protein YjdB
MPHSYISVRTIETRAIITYSSSDMAKIYGFPSPSSEKVVVGVISLGGGLFGSLDSSGILTNGDVQNYWLSQGISAENHPTVVVVGVDGYVNKPASSDGGSTLENTIDVETVGSCCPTSNLTIILYIAPNSENGFYNVFNYAINTPVTVKGVPVKPTVISCSWGAAELYLSSTILTNLNNLFKAATLRGINICVASGDYGSSNGAPGVNVDFPGSSPNVVCCGGTRLICPNKIYDSSTIETVWNNNSTTSATGGGLSKVFTSPSYQSSLAQTKRSVPDIALNSDPNTGVRYLMNGGYIVVGGTSIAAPAFAAFIACIKPTTFINPLLYSYPNTCFYDIVSGNNGAYSAGVGYDKCSGLGSVNGALLSAYIRQNIIFASSISITPSSINVSTLTPVQLNAIILPVDTLDKSITWASNNIAVATVDASGRVTPIGGGSTTITATTINGKVATIPITVSIIQAASISVSPSSINSTTLTPVKLTATILPVNTYIKTIRWASNNTAVATVDASGTVTPIGNGATTITATTSNGKTATVPISFFIQASSISIIPAVSMTTMTPILLTATILPANTHVKTISWSSSNTSVVTVDASGIATPVSNGTASITATTSNGRIATTTVNVNIPVTEINTTIVLSPNATIQLAALIKPMNTVQTSLLWSSSNPSVATVNSLGLITARASGNTVITSKTQDNMRTSSINVTVSSPVIAKPTTGNVLRGIANRYRNA